MPRAGRTTRRCCSFPASRPFDLFDPDRKGRIKLYVKRVFITDDADILPRYLRFVRGLVDSADLPLNVSREKIQESPLLAAISKGATSRVLGELEKLADKEPETYAKIWRHFGAVLKEGLYEDFERRDALFALARFKTTGVGRRLAQPQGLCRRAQDQSDGDLLSRRRRHRAAEVIAASRRFSRPRHRGAAACPIRSTASGSCRDLRFDGKPFKSVTQGAADLALIPLARREGSAGAGD